MAENKQFINIRLKAARLALGVSSGDFAKKANVDPRNYSSIETGKRAVGERVLRDICLAFPINLNWLLDGKGDMLTSDPADTSTDTETGKLIPLYDVEAVAGTSLVDMTPTSRPVEMIEIGSILKDSEAAIRVYGNSMVPNYPAGCIIGVKPYRENFIAPGHVYIIETEENRYLKRIYYNKDKSALRCVSDNTMIHSEGPMKSEYVYPDFEMPLDSVRRLFRVVGVIKRNMM